MASRQTKSPSVRLLRKVYLSSSGCFEWRGACNEHGYGVLGRGRRGQGNIKAHRLAYELFHAVELSSSICVCHRCDNPRCVNPQHLFLGTQQENLSDMFQKGRNASPPLLSGDRNPKAKLDDASVHRVFALRARGFTTYRIADDLGVSRPAICSVLKKKTWRHVDVPSNHSC